MSASALPTESRSRVGVNEKSVDKFRLSRSVAQPVYYKVSLSCTMCTRLRSGMFMNSKSNCWNLD